MENTSDTLFSQKDKKEEEEEETISDIEDEHIFDQEEQLKEMAHPKHARHQVLWEGLLCSHDLSSFEIAQNCPSEGENQKDVCSFYQSKSYCIFHIFDF